MWFVQNLIRVATIAFWAGSGLFLFGGESHSYLPHFTMVNGNWSTEVSLVNDSLNPQDIQLRAYDDQGDLQTEATFSLPPLGGIHGPVISLLPQLTAERGWLEIQASTPSVRGIMKFTLLTTGGTSSLPLTTQVSTRLRMPLLESNEQFTSGIALVNVNDTSVELLIDLLDFDGRVVRAVSRSLPAHAKLLSMLGDLFSEPPPPTASLSVESSAPITGFALSFSASLKQIVAIPAEISEPLNQTDLEKVIGLWKTQGGWIFDIGPDVFSLHETTAVSCLPLGIDAPLEVLNTAIDIHPEIRYDRFSASVRGSTTHLFFSRIADLPLSCGMGINDFLREPTANFEVFWNMLLENYPFFALRMVDWQAQYDHFRPMVTSQTTDAELFQILTEMAAPLEDGHLALDSSFDHFNAGDTPAYRALVQQNTNPAIQNTIDTYLEGGGQSTAAGQIQWGQIGDDLGYMQLKRFSEFSGEEGSEEEDLQVLNASLDTILEDFRDLSGVIIDVRINPGGSDSLALEVAGRFADTPRTGFSERAVEDGGFTPTISHQVLPKGNFQFTGPIVVLIGPGTMSAAENFAMIMSAFPHARLIGESTWGTIATRIERVLPNGWTFTFPNEVEMAPNGLNYEKVGVPPVARVVSFEPSDLEAGVDAAIEAAISLLHP